MRFKLLVIALLSTAASAQAGSIDVITTSGKTIRSVETIKCPNCVAPAKKLAEPVVELAPGTQRIEIREVNGVRKVFRTEAWLGGSPVVHVSKAPPEQTKVTIDEPVVMPEAVVVAPGAVEQPVPSAQSDMIDENSTTSAVKADAGADAEVVIAPKSADFDAGKLELRVN